MEEKDVDVILPEEEVKGEKSAFVLTILSLVFAGIGMSVIALILGIIGLVKACKIRKRVKSPSGKAKAAFVMGIVGVSLSGASILIALFAAALAGGIAAILALVAQEAGYPFYY